MDPYFIFLAAAVVASIVFGPVFGAESRPGFRRPDRKLRPMLSSMRPSDWDKHGWDR
jgi:hypothetical protein